MLTVAWGFAHALPLFNKKAKRGENQVAIAEASCIENERAMNAKIGVDKGLMPENLGS